MRPSTGGHSLGLSVPYSSRQGAEVAEPVQLHVRIIEYVVEPLAEIPEAVGQN